MEYCHYRPWILHVKDGPMDWIIGRADEGNNQNNLPWNYQSINVVTANYYPKIALIRNSLLTTGLFVCIISVFCMKTEFILHRERRLCPEVKVKKVVPTGGKR